MTRKLEPESAKASRKPRADSIRNREKLLAAAHDVFSAGGPNASLEAVARQAGVGIGTLYRHFPTREAMFQAVYTREVDQLVALAGTLAEEGAPFDAVRTWLHAVVGVVATKRGMIAALAPAAGSSDQLYADSSARMMKALTGLMTTAAEAGQIRADIEPGDVMRAMMGICYARDQAPGWQDQVLRLVDVFLDGLRRG